MCIHALALLAPLVSPGGEPLTVTNAHEVAQPLALAAYGDGFGSGLALDGDTLVVGAVFDEAVGDTSGGAYWFEQVAGQWVFQSVLVGDDTTDYDHFGSAVVLDGDTLAIAADADHDAGAQAGSVYLFARQAGAWVQQDHVTPPDWDPFDHFGASLALQGDRLVVGATEPGWPGQLGYEGPGSVYVYGRSAGTWSTLATLNASDGQNYDHLGQALALQGNLLVVSAPGDDDFLLNSGAVYVFTYDGVAWNEVAKLKPLDPAKDQSFGTGLALSASGATLVVGASGDPAAGYNGGAVYLFQGSGASWTQVQKLVPSDLTAGDAFGASVAIDRERLVVGATGADGAAADEGATYVFRRVGGTWHEMAKLSPSDGFAGDALGQHVAIQDQRIATSSTLADPEFWLPNAGSAYLFELGESVDYYCPATVNSSGHAARLGLWGSLGLGDNDLTIAVDDAPAGPIALFLYGPDEAQHPLGNGWLCIGAGSVGVKRIQPFVPLDPLGHAELALDFTGPPFSGGPGQVLPGLTWSLQCWFRDAAAGGGASNLSDAARVTFQP